MKNKKQKIFLGIIIFLILSATIIFSIKKLDTQPTQQVKKIENNKDIVENSEAKNLTFFRDIAGVKATNIELIDNPVGVKGEFLVPEKSILNGINYFLKQTKNDKISNVNIDIEENGIIAKVDYKVNQNITTPIEVKFLPTVDKNNNLILNIKEVKLLDLKLYDWIVDIALKSFIKDWFSKDSNIDVKFEKGNVVIDKNNFKQVMLKNISLGSKDLKINMIIDFNHINN
ncbi:hypothetical protein ANS017_07300 [Paraclostridium bifermentans]|uniref:hypothetical protein n=1 Tax=Paraclostridium bifermentans TaxID=1490 RepID=UPI0021C44AF0|nr:hypothetical protein [Paraclostridium bifermentans]GKZ04989.1 hypothetical protein ANS014_34230 [Paraclostridium bifermentans]GKZ06258.1 hypothetical protein ANS015_11410 [Paraclostridium bifermentans]GKZ09346.1 hypothetical protein ANS017_07300 [Paraclostridium bifermentans]